MTKQEESTVTPLGSHLKDHSSLNVFGPFVTREGAENLRKYHYNGEDHSLLAGYMYYYWKLVIKLFPLRFSPNLITLMGLSCIIFSMSMFYLFSGRIIEVPTGSENPSHLPPSLIALFALNLFLYQTMDAVDGLQGRRVDMYNNPTTEIFDHFIDATVTCLSGITGIGILQLGKWQGLITILCAWITFYCPTIEHLTTGKMIFRGGLSNPTEALVVVQLVTLFTAFYPTVWTTRVLFLQLNSLVVMGGVIGAAIAIYSTMSSIYSHVKGDMSKFKVAIQGFAPLAFVIACSTAWLIFSPFKPNSIAYRTFPVLTLATVACPWLYSIIRIIISEIQLINFDVAGVLVGQLGLLLPVLTVHLLPLHVAQVMEIPAMLLSLAISGGMLAYTVSQVVGQTCTALGMRHFYSIPKFERATKA